ncbi:hypothetical protein [Hydrogenimonas sp. SS33]|uniref:hypothetical protein n=1 Tax=Hydrogenimonas leucolamina TaxID=2954236 RepID=UPI00336BC64F
MFATMHNQKRAQELIDRSVEMIESADDRFARAKAALEERIKSLDAIRSHLIAKSLATLRKRFETMSNEPPLEIAPAAEEPTSRQVMPLFERADLEPVEIKEVRRGKAGAFFGALFAALLTVAVALIVAAVATGEPLTPETLTDPAKLDVLLTWIGGGAIPGTVGNPLLGAAGLLVAAIAAWLIAWSVLMAKASRRNLAAAEEVYEAAKAYHDKKSDYAEAAEKLAGELEALRQILETCDIYLQEYNASLRRILHMEGEDYESFKPASKERVEQAAECAHALVPLLNIAVVTTEGTPSHQLQQALERGRLVVEALKEERPLPTFDDTPAKTAEPESETEVSEPIILGYKPEESEEEKPEETEQVEEQEETPGSEESGEKREEESRKA